MKAVVSMRVLSGQRCATSLRSSAPETQGMRSSVNTTSISLPAVARMARASSAVPQVVTFIARQTPNLKYFRAAGSSSTYRTWQAEGEFMGSVCIWFVAILAAQFDRSSRRLLHPFAGNNCGIRESDRFVDRSTLELMEWCTSPSLHGVVLTPRSSPPYRQVITSIYVTSTMS